MKKKLEKEKLQREANETDEEEVKKKKKKQNKVLLVNRHIG